MRAKLLLAAAALSSALLPPAAQTSAASRPSAAAPNAFGSVGLSLGETRYSQRWRRAALTPVPAELHRIVRPARALAPLARAETVNAALNRRIRYRFDSHPSGDEWASASDTLRRGAGDCEDYVIAKMQALRGLGVPARDLFMTIGQDMAAGTAHAVLLVRSGGRFWVLDNRSDRLVPDGAYRDFHPMLSFGADGSNWLHGYRRGQTPPAVKAMSAAFASGEHVRLGSSEASRRPRRA